QTQERGVGAVEQFFLQDRVPFSAVPQDLDKLQPQERRFMWLTQASLQFLNQVAVGLLLQDSAVMHAQRLRGANAEDAFLTCPGMQIGHRLAGKQLAIMLQWTIGLMIRVGERAAD